VSRSLNNQFIGSPDKTSLFRTMNEGPREGVFQAVGLDGTKRLFAFHKLYLHGEQTPYLYIRVGIPERAIVAQANRALRHNLLVLAPFPLLGLFIIWGIGKKAIVDRVAMLQAAAQRLAGGDLDVRVSNQVTGGELGALGLAFDDMAEHLAKRDKDLRESQQENAFLTGLLEQSSQPFAIGYPDGRIGRFNPAFLTLLGYRSDEVHVLEWSRDLTPPEWRAREEEKLMELEHSDQPVRYEKEYLRKDGSQVPVELLTHVVRDPDGAPAFYYAFITDITERKHAQREMLKTDKLESLGVLAGGIAHDFNNILTAILGNISLAQMYVNDPDALRKRLEDAEHAALRAKGLTRQLLTFARGGEPVKKFVQIRKLLEEAAGFATVGSIITYEVFLTGDFWVEADEGQLSQVFHNLVLNAVQAMPEGGALVIRVAMVRTGPERKPVLTIAVTDTGVGIPEHDLTRIFDPYFTTKLQGNGLGLATCHSIITRHGGTISVESTPGHGSTFLVTLPALDLGDASDSERSRDTTPGRGRILVLDDEAPVREICRSMLDLLGYAVECVADGDEAVTLYEKRKKDGIPFAAVIMDLTVPGGRGGKDALAALLMIDPEVRAIVSSGYAEDPVMANFREYGFSAGLGKPYLLQELSTVLREVLPEDGYY
jgi:PAS domain S-box-containing protein